MISQCLWWFYLEDWVETGEVIDFEFAKRRFQLPCREDHEKRQAMETLGRFLETSPLEVVERFQQDVLEPRFGDPLKKTRIYSLNWPQIRALSQDPLVTIASHGTSHNNCTCLTPADLEASLIQAKTRIEEETDKTIEHFAYPFGHARSFDEDVIRMVAKAGYRTAMTTLHGTLKRTHCQDLFRLPRICLNSKSEAWLELLCSGMPRRYYM